MINKKLINKFICIVSQSHLCRNPRVLKEAITLENDGYQVKILTAIYSNALLNEDIELIKNTTIIYSFYSDLRHPNINSFICRIMRKAAFYLQSNFNIESELSLGFNGGKMLKKCILNNADLYIMHQELATVIGCKMCCDYKVAFDIEDWYSEDLLPSARRSRPINLLKNAEAYALKKGVYCTTTSQVMANVMKTTYKSEKAPCVIYNSFDNVSPEFRHVSEPYKINLYWFSQTIGEGRGLEFFISCLAKSSFAWQLNLRGNISPYYRDHLKKLVSDKDKLVLLPLLKNEDILKDMNNYDIGLSLELNSPPNKDLTISNKFFHYMAAGLPMIASETKGHAEIGLKHPNIIFIYRQDNETDLVTILDKIGAKISGSSVNFLREKILQVYNESYSWGIESKKLTQLVNNAIQSNC